MKTSIGVLLALTLMQPAISLADGYRASGAVVVGGNYGYGPRGGYYGPRGGYYGPGWGRPYGGPAVGVYFGAPLGWGWPWGPPVYYPPPVVYPPLVTVPPPVVYVERADPGAPPVSGSEESL